MTRVSGEARFEGGPILVDSSLSRARDSKNHKATGIEIANLVPMSGTAQKKRSKTQRLNSPVVKVASTKKKCDSRPHLEMSRRLDCVCIMWRMMSSARMTSKIGFGLSLW